MSEVCSDCGLPKDLCVCETIAKEQQKIIVSIEKRKFGKKYTIIRGFEKGIDLDDLAKKLKAKFACGGTSKNEAIELQGDHKSKAKEVLLEMGFPSETIEIK
ncbi:translation initiation factor [Nanoarchaeota archaeon]